MLKHVIVSLIVLLSLLNSEAFAETQWVSGTIMKGQAQVLKKPEQFSEVIGTYPEGTSLIFFYPKVNHYYAVYFKDAAEEKSKGWIHESQLLIFPPNEPPFVPFIPLDPKAYRLDQPRAHVSLSGFFNSLEYQQAPLRPFIQDSLIAKLEGEIPIYSRAFNFSAQLSYTLFPNSTSIAGINARFFRTNLQMHVHVIQTPATRLSLVGGISYLKSFIPQSAYGYQDFTFPRIYPTFEFVFRQRFSLRTLISYMPFINTPTKGSEFMLEMTLFYHLLSDHAFFTRLNYSEILFPSTNATRQNTLQLGMGYRF
jgi:hypothetical protein